MITWEAERRFEEQVESREREREISPVPGLSWNSCKHERVESREREISPVPGLSWNSCKHKRGESVENQERSHQFLGSQGTAANIKEVNLWRTKRDLTSSWALKEQLKKNRLSPGRGRGREISPVPGLSWISCKMDRLSPKRGRERSHQFLGSHGTAAKWTGW
jgi:hypothetical protein